MVNLAIAADGGLVAADFSIPWEKRDLDGMDKDLGTSAFVLLEPAVFATGRAARLGCVAGKTGKLYVLDADNLGDYEMGAGRRDAALQVAQLGGAVFASVGSYPHEGGWLYATPVGRGLGRALSRERLRPSAAAQLPVGGVFTLNATLAPAGPGAAGPPTTNINIRSTNLGAGSRPARPSWCVAGLRRRSPCCACSRPCCHSARQSLAAQTHSCWPSALRTAAWPRSCWPHCVGACTAPPGRGSARTRPRAAIRPATRPRRWQSAPSCSRDCRRQPCWPRPSS